MGHTRFRSSLLGTGLASLSLWFRIGSLEPRGTGMALYTLRAAEEVRAAQFSSGEGEFEAEMVAIAGAILKQADQHIRPEHLPRPLSRRLTGADRGKDARAHHETERGRVSTTRYRSDGRAETQPCSGASGSKAFDPGREENKKGSIRSAPTSLVIARFRRGDTQGRGRSPIGNSWRKAAQAGLMGRVSSWSNTSA
jgi:hypothetical protein